MVCAIGGLHKCPTFIRIGDTFGGCWLLLILMIVSTQKFGQLIIKSLSYISMVCAIGVFINVPNSYACDTFGGCCAPMPFLYTLHMSQVMLWGLKRAERLPCFVTEEEQQEEEEESHILGVRMWPHVWPGASILKHRHRHRASCDAKTN